MTPASRITLALVALAVLALAAWQLLGAGRSDDRPTPIDDGAPIATPAGDAEPRSTTDATRTEAISGREPDAGDRSRTTVDEPPATDSAAQGLRGRVVGSRGEPIDGAQVFLMKGPSADLLTALQLARQGVILPPIAITASAQDGTFSIGVRNPVAGQAYEIRVQDPLHADTVVPGLRVEPAVWHDLGDVSMPRGLVVYGQVTVSGTNRAGVPGATVYARAIEGISGLNPAPGREKGITTTADESGNYRFENLRHGLYTLSAVAPGHAKGERPNCPIRPEDDNRYDFALEIGKSIAGRVVDSAGEPVRRALVRAVALSSKMPVAEDTLSDGTGAFEVLGLVDGPYELSASALGYVEARVNPILAGQQDGLIVLERQCHVRLRVSAKSGRSLRSFQVTMRRYFEGQDQLGNVATAPMRLVHARDLDNEGFVEIDGIDPGAYVFEIVAADFAKTYSEPFLVELGGAVPLVDVTMKIGGTLRGVVHDVDGAPIAGVEVKTVENYIDDHVMSTLFGGMIPSKITRASARTDATGGYVLAGLSAGTYQLRFEHGDFAPHSQKDLAVVDESTTEVPTIQLLAGTLISGTTYVDGVPSALVKVTIQTTVSDTDAGRPPFAVEVISGSGGQFAMPRRLPAGSYTARAARQNLALPLLQAVDLAKTQREFDVAPGQTSLTLNFSIQSEGQ